MFAYAWAIGNNELTFRKFENSRFIFARRLPLTFLIEWLVNEPLRRIKSDRDVKRKWKKWIKLWDLLFWLFVCLSVSILVCCFRLLLRTSGPKKLILKMQRSSVRVRAASATTTTTTKRRVPNVCVCLVVKNAKEASPWCYELRDGKENKRPTTTTTKGDLRNSLSPLWKSWDSKKQKWIRGERWERKTTSGVG